MGTLLKVEDFTPYFANFKIIFFSKLQQEGRVVLSTPNGALRGRVQSFKAGTRGFYYSFSGIRYGEAPIGNRRYTILKLS